MYSRLCFLYDVIPSLNLFYGPAFRETSLSRYTHHKMTAELNNQLRTLTFLKWKMYSLAQIRYGSPGFVQPPQLISMYETLNLPDEL